MAHSITAAFSVACLIGCTAVRPVQHPADYILNKHPHRVTLTRAGGSTTTLYHPHVLGDSVTGFDGSTDVTLPLDGSAVVEARQLDPLRTSVLVGTVTLATAATWLLMSREPGSLCGPPVVDADGLLVRPC